MEERLGVDFVAWRIGDGPLNLGSLRVLRRGVSKQELERAKETFLPHAVIGVEANLRIVRPGEPPLAKAGSKRWEFAEPMKFSTASDTELTTIAKVMGDQASRTKRDIIVISDNVTIESFYRGINSIHGTRTPDGEYDGTPNEKSKGSASKVDEAEQRLSVVLPAGLRQLYELQNGGYINSICIPKADVADHASYEDVVNPFSGYDTLDPLEHLRTVYDSFLDFGDPEDDSYASYFQGGVEKLVVLTQYYQETLFVDYRNPSSVGIGFVDFAADDWPDRIMSWESFDSFFDALRHYESV